MADVNTRRPAQPLMRPRLEWQQRQNMIYVAAHGARAPGRQAHTEGET